MKKRWHAIYERVADVDSELLPPPVADSRDTSSRGTERERGSVRRVFRRRVAHDPPKRQMAYLEARSLTNKVRVVAR